MTSLLPRSRFHLADPFEWLEQSWPFAGMEHPIRIEESIQDDTYRVRAELPGFDPESEIHVTAERGLLTISAQRESKEAHGGVSEFRYGSFSRTRTLPPGADADKISATYQKGILEVTVPVAKRPETTEVPIKAVKD